MASNYEGDFDILPEFRDAFDEIFGNKDSGEEFEGFEVPSNLEDEEEIEVLQENPEDILADGNWSGVAANVTPHAFTAASGCTVVLPDEPTFLDFVSLFIKEDFERMTCETNHYAFDYILSNPELKTHSRFRLWPEDGITTGEMKCIIALIIAMELVKHDDLKDYWSTDEVISTLFLLLYLVGTNFLIF